jgi:putative endonuclease
MRKASSIAKMATGIARKRRMSRRRGVALKRTAKAVVPARRRAVEPKACCCYILECSDGTFYTGWAVDAERRLKVHNAGRGAKYTRARRPVKLVYVEPQPDRATAMKRERAIKKLTRQKKQRLIRST